MNHQAKIIPVSCIYMLIQSQYRPLLNVTICAKSRYARLWISIHDYKPPESDLIQRKHVSKSDRIMHSCSEWLKGMTTISASVSSCTSCFFFNVHALHLFFQPQQVQLSTCQAPTKLSCSLGVGKRTNSCPTHPEMLSLDVSCGYHMPACTNAPCTLVLSLCVKGSQPLHV